MFPWYSTIPQDYSLPRDDLEAIKYLYGEREEARPPPRPAAPRPRPTPPATPRTSPRPRLGHGDAAASSPNKCNTNFDAVAVLRGEMWVFKSKFFWRINKDGGSREDPMELRSFWYGLPSDVDHIDAVYEKSDHDIVFFVGKKYYILASNSYLRYGPLPITVSQRKRSRSAIRLKCHYHYHYRYRNWVFPRAWTRLTEPCAGDIMIKPTFSQVE